MNWWQNGGWREPQPRELVDDPNYVYIVFNPQCRHERTSYDLMNCDNCIAHSKELHDLQQRAKLATPIEVANNSTLKGK